MASDAEIFQKKKWWDVRTAEQNSLETCYFARRRLL